MALKIKLSSNVKHILQLVEILAGDRLSADEQEILTILLSGPPSKEQLRAALAALTATPPTP